MAIQSTRRDTRGTPLALLFTDARGRVVFVDNKFLELMRYPEATSLVGEALHKVVGVDAPAIMTMMQDAARQGYVHERPLTLHLKQGETLPVLASSVATYNTDGEFIGVDITFHNAADASTEDETAPVHGNVLQTRIQQIHDEAESKALAQIAAQQEKRAQEAEAMSRMAEEDRQKRAEQIARERAEMEARVLPQLYFTAQVNALQVLLARMGGPRIHDTLESNLNKAAAKGNWPIKILGGQITVSEAGAPPEAYQSLLRGVIDYGANIIGRASILDEMRAVDAAMNPRTCEIAGNAGLRQFFT